MMSASQHPSVEIGSPPEFKGTPDVWCPEDLLVGAVNSCLMLTFLSLAQHKKLEVIAYESIAQGTLEHRDGKYRVTRVTVQPRVTLNSDADGEVARGVMQETKEACMITNSIIGTVDIEPEFSGQSAHFNSDELVGRPGSHV